MSTLNTTLITTLLIAAPALAVAQETGAEAAGQAKAAAEATAQTATPEARIEAAMQAAAEAEIPVSLLESKVQEGRAKGVPMERVAAAVETRLEALVRARNTLAEAGAGAVTAGELLVTAEALRVGVSENALAQVVAKAPAERRAVATAVLTDLVRLGYDSGAAWTRLQASLSSGPEALVNLRAEAAASLRARGLISTDIGGGAGGGLDF